MMNRIGSSMIGSITSGLLTQGPWLHVILALGLLGLVAAFVTVALVKKRAGYYAGMLSFVLSMSVSVTAMVGTTSLRGRADIDRTLLGRVAVPVAFITSLVGIAGTVRRLRSERRRRGEAGPETTRQIEPRRSRVVGVVGGVMSTAFMLGAAMPLLGDRSEAKREAREAVDLLRAGDLTAGCARLRAACEKGARVEETQGFASAVSTCFEVELIRALESPDPAVSLDELRATVLPLSTRDRERLDRETVRLSRSP